jgi:hypothetical protein
MRDGERERERERERSRDILSMMKPVILRISAAVNAFENATDDAAAAAAADGGIVVDNDRRWYC